MKHTCGYDWDDINEVIKCTTCSNKLEFNDWGQPINFMTPLEANVNDTAKYITQLEQENAELKRQLKQLNDDNV